MSVINRREAKSKGRSQRRKQNQGHADDDPDCKGQPCRDCKTDGSQHLRVNGADCSQRDQYQSGSTDFGGILSESIVELEDQLAEIDEDIQALQRKRDRLQSRRDRFTRMFSEIQQHAQP
ncbi:MAG: hypothetical protein HC769_34940 [Cyanobacteria bacterium CRU_2_1]|nr:hypothetical protein [Cyanobacteria bacterium RU_5_0]NJR63524.1 hypothetical protein [Cyanobacteria bacterium CRU_2_1]